MCATRFALHIWWICSHKSPLTHSDTHSLSHTQTLTLVLSHTLPPSIVAFHVSMAPLTDLRESPGWSLGLGPPLNILTFSFHKIFEHNGCAKLQIVLNQKKSQLFAYFWFTFAFS